MDENKLNAILRKLNDGDDELLSEPALQAALSRIRQIGRNEPSFDNAQSQQAEVPAHVGQYEIVDRIGEGGMGTVYLARHKKMNRLVAIKLLRSGKRVSKDSIARFENEMRAAGKIRHDNLVYALDAGEIDGKPYLVMEYIEGVNVSTLARRRSRLSVADCCEIARQLSLALDNAHNNELIHRDIKPSNLMIDRTGIVKLLDLGLAKLTENQLPNPELTATGHVMGTVDYMSPEQAEDSSAVDHRTDLYSIGATLYCLLTSNPPFTDKEYKSVSSKLLAIASKAPAPIMRRRDDIPNELAAVIHRLLAKNADDRFDSASELTEALTPFCKNSDLKALVANSILTSEASSTNESSTFPTKSALVGTDARIAQPDKSSVARFPRQKTDSKKRWWQQRRAIWSMIAATFAFAVVLGITIGVTRPGQGDLIIQYDGDQDIQITITTSKGNDQSFRVTKGADNIYKLRSGKTEVQVAGADAQKFEISPGEFYLSKGGKRIVSIRHRQGKSADLEFARWIMAEELWTLSDRNAPHGGNNFAPRIVAYYEVDGVRKHQIWPDNEPFRQDLRIVNVSIDNPTPEIVRKLAELKHLRELSIGDILIDSWTNLPAEELTSLSHNGPGINSKEFIDFVARIKNLRSLRIGNEGSRFNAPLSILSFKKMVPLCPNLVHLDLSSIRNVNDDWMPSIAKLPKLQELFLARTTISDTGIVYVGELPNLRRLNLTETQISDQGLSSLSGCQLLGEIRLDDTKVTGRGLIHLKTLPALELRLGGASLAADLPVHLQALDNLATLKIVNAANFDDSSIEAFGQLSRLQSFSLQNSQLTPGGVLRLQKLLESAPPTTSVDITSSLKESTWIEELGGRIGNNEEKQIVSIDLSGTNIDRHHIERLAEFPLLISLNLNDTDLDDEGCQELRGRPLVALELVRTNVTNAGINALGDCRTLEELDLQETKITDQCASDLVRLSKLATLVINHTEFGDSGIEQLGLKLPLKVLHLSGCPITDKALMTISKMPGVYELSLNGCTNITDEGLTHLQKLEKLETLMLADCPVSAGAIAKLNSLPKLKALHIGKRSAEEKAQIESAFSDRVQIRE